MGNKHKINRAV